MEKYTLHANKLTNLFFCILISLFFAGCSTTELKTPKTASSIFEQSYKGIKPNNSTQRTIIACDESEIIKLEPNEFSYAEIVEEEYRQGNIEVGHSTLQNEPISGVKNKIENFAEDIGACKAYWVVQDIIDPNTNAKSSKVYYGISYFAKVDKNSIIGFYPGEPSNAKKQEMDRYYGVEVKAIMPETAAEKIGLKEKDIILFINHQRCTYGEFVQNMCGVNSRWSIVRIYRDGEVMDIKN